MCDQVPPTPAHSVSPDQDIAPNPPSSLSSNSQAVYYGDAAAIAKVYPTHGLTNALDVLALVRNGTFTEEDVVMDHAQPDGFEEALQSF